VCGRVTHSSTSQQLAIIQSLVNSRSSSTTQHEPAGVDIRLNRIIIMFCFVLTLLCGRVSIINHIRSLISWKFDPSIWAIWIMFSKFRSSISRKWLLWCRWFSTQTCIRMRCTHRKLNGALMFRFASAGWRRKKTKILTFVRTGCRLAWSCIPSCRSHSGLSRKPEMGA